MSFCLLARRAALTSTPSSSSSSSIAAPSPLSWSPAWSPSWSSSSALSSSLAGGRRLFSRKSVSAASTAASAPSPPSSSSSSPPSSSSSSSPSSSSSSSHARKVNVARGRLAGRVAVVTGGTRGIGLATVRRLVAEGAQVFAWDLPAAVAEAERATERALADGDAAATAAALPAGVHVQAVDVTNRDAVLAAFEASIEASASDTVNVLVNNAGVTADALLERTTADAWERVLAVNLTGTMITTQVFAWHFSKRVSDGAQPSSLYGRIVNTSSISAFGNKGQANYSAAKAGVIGLTKTMALELAPLGVTVNAVAPGFVATAMTDAMPVAVRERFVQRVPLQRMGVPDEIAAATAFLASPDAAYVTGQVLTVDGGLKSTMSA